MGERFSPAAELDPSPDDAAWMRWLDGGLKGEAPAISPTSPISVRRLRAMTEAARSEAVALIRRPGGGTACSHRWELGDRRR